MLRRLLALLVMLFPVLVCGLSAREAKHARSVTIYRDDWGIAHIYGRTDADAVFGMIYTQAEDDFNRIENNYLTYLGRLAEAEGDSAIIKDLRQRLFIDPDVLKTQYAASPAWLKRLMDAFADGLNFYLVKHPETHPRVLTHFEPWMALCFTEGSIGGDIERINLPQLQAFYDKSHARGEVSTGQALEREPSGSNGIAIAPKNTANGHALLLINPHTSFFFRSELQMVSKEGLNAYGAVTWGQFFVYQGFNERAGWMHTSSGVDAVDEYAESVHAKDGHFVYRHGDEERPVTWSTIVISYKTGDGMKQKRFTTYRTHHGPIIREADGKWISIRLMQEPIKALMQSYLRTKAHNYPEYVKTMDLKANSSNNTIFADADGDIAYFHGNYIPRRNTKFDWTKVVDGSDKATEWQGLLSVDETPHLLNPASGWLYNVNNWPWSAAGASSPKKDDYPAYVETGTESARGRHAMRLLGETRGFTLDSLVTAAYDSYLPWFAQTIPVLVKAWDAAPPGDPMKEKLAQPVDALRAWDSRWSVGSVPTSLAVFWGEQISRRVRASAKQQKMLIEDYVAQHATRQELLESLSAASDKLTADFGTWKTPWGEINRFQRINGDIVQPFNDNAPSIPVGFTSSIWGSLASFGAHAYPDTKKWYGTSGNSFVAAVEFGSKVRARAVTAGGESGNLASPHFDDEADRYSKGNLRQIYFYRSDLKGHIEKQYHPGEAR